MSDKTYAEKLADRIQSMTISEEAKRQLNGNTAYRKVLRANKVEAARDSLHVSIAISKEKAQASLMQRLANADAILALSEADKNKLTKATTALQPPKAPKPKAKKANGKGKNGNTKHIASAPSVTN